MIGKSWTGFVVTLTLAGAAFGQTTVVPVKTECRTASGVMQETIAPTSQVPNDPFGRIIGLWQGDFAGVSTVAVTAFLVTQPAFSAATGPSSVMTVRHVFLTGPGDTIITLGATIFNPAPGTLPGQNNGVSSVCPFTPCIVENPQVLNIIGGTGRWVGATGQLRNIGLGNLDLLNPNGQAGAFVFISKGEICIPKP